SDNRAQSMAVLPDGRFVLAGLTFNLGSGHVGSISLARFNANGTPDTTFGNKGTVVTSIAAVRDMSFRDHAVSVALDDNGRLVVSGRTPQSATGDRGDFLVARLNANGSLDTTFGAAGTGVATTDLKSGGSGYDVAQGLTLQADGKIVVAGATATDLPDD